MKKLKDIIHVIMMHIIAVPLITIFSMMAGYKTDNRIKLYVCIWLVSWFVFPLYMVGAVLIGCIYFGGVILHNKYVIQ